MDVSASVLSSGLAGIQAGQQRAERAASELASGTVTTPSSPARGTVELASQLVELNQARLEVEASARVVDTADEVLGTLVNTHA